METTTKDKPKWWRVSGDTDEKTYWRLQRYAKNSGLGLLRIVGMAVEEYLEKYDKKRRVYGRRSGAAEG